MNREREREIKRRKWKELAYQNRENERKIKKQNYKYSPKKIISQVYSLRRFNNCLPLF